MNSRGNVGCKKMQPTTTRGGRVGITQNNALTQSLGQHQYAQHGYPHNHVFANGKTAEKTIYRHYHYFQSINPHSLDITELMFSRVAAPLGDGWGPPKSMQRRYIYIYIYIYIYTHIYIYTCIRILSKEEASYSIS